MRMVKLLVIPTITVCTRFNYLNHGGSLAISEFFNASLSLYYVAHFDREVGVFLFLAYLQTRKERVPVQNKQIKLQSKAQFTIPVTKNHRIESICYANPNTENENFIYHDKALCEQK